MPARQGEAWNDEDVATLRDMARAGEPLTAIARRLGRTREAVYTRARKLKVAVQSV